MCGITGWVDWTKDLTRETQVLQAMNARLADRGPDAEGYWVSPHAALGHRRLVVVDPLGGGQPNCCPRTCGSKWSLPGTSSAATRRRWTRCPG